MSKNVWINILYAGVNKKVNFEHVKEILWIFEEMRNKYTKTGGHF